MTDTCSHCGHGTHDEWCGELLGEVKFSGFSALCACRISTINHPANPDWSPKDPGETT